MVTAIFPEDEWVYGYVLSYGNYVEVLEPFHIREIIIGKMKDSLNKCHKEISQGTGLLDQYTELSIIPSPQPPHYRRVRIDIMINNYTVLNLKT
ncbi:MAG: WYL domain-containing protein [Bacillota bacterium]